MPLLAPAVVPTVAVSFPMPFPSRPAGAVRTTDEPFIAALIRPFIVDPATVAARVLQESRADAYVRNR